ncbi:hypothetical protein B7H17_06655 [Pseudomonas putida]|uniref:Uncharacterized protein n=1 Tax=Pseudomonas putida TaxID=303 RepID=A0A1X1A3F3_PSEPU|nr:hypothetical protein B7H17_06655 [Pseudomonas putida]
MAAESLNLSRLTLEASQRTEQSEEAKRKAEAERVAAEKAKADLEQAKAEAERTIKLIAEITRLYNGLKESLAGWVMSVKSYDHIDAGLAKNEVISTAEEIQSHDKYDDSMEWVLFTEIEMAETDLEPYLAEKKPISSKVRRRKGPKLMM